MAAIIFDTETTGLPNYKCRGIKPDYINAAMYSTCRMVSISWIVADAADADASTDASASAPAPAPTKYPVYYIVKPEGSTEQSTPESIAIHGITHEMAMERGVPFGTIIDHLFADINRALSVTSSTTGPVRLVAHNLDFDFNILCSELYRRGMLERIAELKPLKKFCTMLEGQKLMGVSKWPKLAELYRYVTNGEEITNAHNAMYDTIHCHRCYTELVSNAC